MRRSTLFAISTCWLAACESSDKVTPVTVQWMDWPAEVNAGQPFRTRLVVWGVCAVNPQFRPGASADQVAVTFTPYFMFADDNINCLGSTGNAFVVNALDTAGIAPGLRAINARLYEMRAPLHDFALGGPATGLTASTFGNVVVRPTGADASRRNAAGYVTVERDSLNCLRVRPLGALSGNALLLDDQTATADGIAFVRGYIYSVGRPFCGETILFHRDTT